MTSSSVYADLVDRPLFGETRSLDRISFIIITALTTIFVLATFVGMFLFKHISGTHIFLNICLILLLCSHLCLAFWYRSGELEPRFRNMLFFNTAVIVLLCISANLIISGR
ncbi:unnamed protein product [Rotaria socialis]|uniref:Transmembrane protein n=2 Tax=Rotaria TaxID=231623 RepID=A0A818YZ19_9BILA|nr:unnamed protein product [Rotaria magnacalcarata]CAF3161848.1 unnamed protein product [Rotaria socialis]CAF1606062.1 unnamed protein product [Rotaria magnacalcarata]CAF2000213.1 unnamed protein product [Rotaria magnacalcarata]CAF2021645.1 unnamed protein product [Rotaria magnacalcarata]